MGTIKSGILGGFSGKVGTVVGASWRGIDYMRGLPKVSNKPATSAQIGQRTKMTLLRAFLLGVKSIVDESFQNYQEKTEMNAALSYNLTHSITGDCPDYRIHFPNLLFSKGTLLGAWSPAAISAEPYALDFSWANGSFSPMCDTGDKATLVVYNPAKSLFVSLQQAALREDGWARIVLPETFSGDLVHCYLSFLSEAKIASTNQYLGEVLVL